MSEVGKIYKNAIELLFLLLRERQIRVAKFNSSRICYTFEKLAILVRFEKSFLQSIEK